MKKRTELINKLITENNYSSYLEIGVRNPNDNFNLIECENKSGVDPKGNPTHKMTSDEFFEQNHMEFDIVFIDGLHTYEQVRKDFDNAKKCCTGHIVLHDCKPPTESHKRPYSEYLRDGGGWCGQVYQLCAEEPLIKVLPIETGIGIYEAFTNK